MKVEDINFDTSYVITTLNCDNDITEYNKINISNLHVYYDNNLDVILEETKQSQILLLGYCFDIRNSQKGTHQLLLDLLESKNLHDDLDYINGRYILIINQEQALRIYSDASQLRPLVYHQSSKSLASHDSLLKMVLEKHGYTFNKRSEHNHTELDYTRFKEIFKFNPSLYLDITDYSFTRFYPRNQLTSRSIEETSQELKPYLDQSIKYLEGLNNKIFLSITGGIDSRVSASLTRDFSNKITYLTYTKPKKKISTRLAKHIYKLDKEITQDMKDYLGWNHEIINLYKYTPSKSQINTNHIKYNSIHSYALANYYKNTMKYHKATHIKSTVFGLGKADFPSYLDNHKDTFEFYTKCIHGIPKSFKVSPNYKDKVYEYFIRNKVFEGVTLGRHYYDLFHLESRMGNWHSMITLETDPETEEFIFTNSRKIIDLIQQPDIDNRRQHNLYKKIIDNYWPVLLKFEVNQSKKDAESIKMNGVVFQNINNMKIELLDNEVYVLPNAKEIKEYEQYSLKIDNELNNQERKLNITSFYSKKTAVGKIKVFIKNKGKAELLDILDFNKGYKINASDSPIIISILYNHDYKKASWIGAGKLKIEVLN